MKNLCSISSQPIKTRVRKGYGPDGFFMVCSQREIPEAPDQEKRYLKVATQFAITEPLRIRPGQSAPKTAFARLLRHCKAERDRHREMIRYTVECIEAAGFAVLNDLE